MGVSGTQAPAAAGEGRHSQVVVARCSLGTQAAALSMDPESVGPRTHAACPVGGADPGIQGVGPQDLVAQHSRALERAGPRVAEGLPPCQEAAAEARLRTHELLLRTTKPLSAGQ